MNIISAASDAFSNPDSPLYYIVGVAFLLLIFAALGAYVFVSGKKKKQSEQTDKSEKEQTPEKAEDEQGSAEGDDKNAQAEEPEIKEQTPEKAEAEQKADEQTEQAPIEQKGEETEAEKPKTARRAPTKPFIDRLISAKNIHLTYNAVKNVILSYPGIKASLTKKEELFYFGQDKKASIDVTDATVELKLAISPEAVPAEFAVDKANGDLPTAMSVPEEKAASAEKLITFAMNVSMLTKNEKHRYVDYVQNAINAKNRAKKK